MINPIGQNDLSLLLRLIVAHLIVDFLFQTDSWVEDRFETDFWKEAEYNRRTN